MKQFYEARAEHAWLLRAEGLVFREIGRRLGIGKDMARVSVFKFGRRMTQAIMKHDKISKGSVAFEKRAAESWAYQQAHNWPGVKIDTWNTIGPDRDW